MRLTCRKMRDSDHWLIWTLWDGDAIIGLYLYEEYALMQWIRHLQVQP